MPELSSTQVRERYGLKPVTRPHIILNTLQHVLNNIIDSILDGQHDALHNENPWLPALLKTVEIALLFGCVNASAFWDILEGNCGAEEAVKNVNMFTSISTGVGKLRVWIRLSLLGGSLCRQLKSCLPKLQSIMTKQSVLSCQFRQLFQLLSSLDTIDIILYVQEKDITNERIPFDKLFSENDDLLDLTVCGVQLPNIGTSLNSPKVDVLKLQTALRSQTSQRLYYQEECKRLQERVSELESQLETLMKGDPNEIVALRISVLEERLKQSELCREEQRKRLLLLQK